MRSLFASQPIRWICGRRTLRLAAADASRCLVSAITAAHSRSLHSSSAGASPTLPPQQKHEAAASPRSAPKEASGTASNTAAASSSPAAFPQPVAPILRLAAADAFAQSRIKNYLQRTLATPAPAGTPADDAMRSPGIRSLADVVPRRLSRQEADLCGGSIDVAKAWLATFNLPVDVCCDGRLTRVHIPASGVATEPKTAVIAACMHAERCLDELHVPLFTSVARQHQRVVQAEAEGRTAAEVSAAPRELKTTALPQLVLLPKEAATTPAKRLASYQPTAMPAAAGRKASGSRETAGGNGSATAASGSGVHSSSSSAASSTMPRRAGTASPPKRQKPRRRFDSFKARFSEEVFLQSVSKELAELHATLFAHNSPAEGDGEDDGDDGDDGDGDGGAIAITAEEVSILQPELLEPRGAAATVDPAAAASALRRGPNATRHSRVMLQPPSTLQAERHRRGPDESEGGVFEMVDCRADTWELEAGVPGPACLLDTAAVGRIDQYLCRSAGDAFADVVQLRYADEDTMQFLPAKGAIGIAEVRWYTATVQLPELGVSATGKAVTKAVAKALCAMHAELLLQWFGIAACEGPHAQARYYDACLRWGRHVAPEPIDPATVDVATARLPKPLKENIIDKRRQWRNAPLSVVEKLLRLNRYLVSMYRKHLIEVDILDSSDYAELHALCEPCVRSFMVAMKHPYEGAYFNFVYEKNNQMRTTIYLPLPERYGVRGGYAIARTPRHGIVLCALSAVDVLCALDVIPEVCLAQPQWQRLLALRESLGFILPPSYVYRARLAKATTTAAREALGPPPPPPHPMLRSPPSYRESPGYSATVPPYDEVWRIMLLDAEVFDVIPSAKDLQELSMSMAQCDYPFLPQQFFEEACALLFHWDAASHEQRRHMRHYTGMQIHRGFLKASANNFWLHLPLDEKVYGTRVAIGRCQTRRGAERVMYVHALRILRALRLTPHDTLTTSQLCSQLYRDDPRLTRTRQREWKWLCDAVLDGREDVLERHSLLATAEAEVMQETVRGVAADGGSASLAAGPGSPMDMSKVLSPHPVMSREMARVTFG